jgi:hypothetical protein
VVVSKDGFIQLGKERLKGTFERHTATSLSVELVNRSYFGDTFPSVQNLITINDGNDAFCPFRMSEFVPQMQESNVIVFVFVSQ